MRRFLVSLFLTLALAGLSLTLLVNANRQVSSEAVRSLNAQQMILARQAAQGIKDFFDAQRRILLVMSKNQHVIRMDDDGKVLLSKLLEANPDTLQAATRVGRDGRILYSFPTLEVAGWDISYQSHVARILAERQPVVSDVFIAVQGYPSIALHVPVFDDQRFAGTLAVLIPFEVISRHNLQTIRVAQSGYAFVVSECGIELYSPVPGHTGKSIFENARDFPDILAMAERMLRGEEGEASYFFDIVRDVRVDRVRKHAVFTPVHLGNTFWSICVTTPEDEVLVGIKEFQNTWMLMLAVLSFSGLIVCVFLVRAFFNIKAKRQRSVAEEALARHHVEMEESHTKLSMAMEMASMGHWELDLATNVFTFNDQFYTLYGTTSEREGGPFMSAETYAREFVHPAETEIVATEIGRALTSERMESTTQLEHRIIRRDGKVRHIVVRFCVIRDQDGSPIKTIGANQDITEHKEAEEAMLRAKEAAEAANRSKSEFLATMSHEIRTPLNGLLGMLQLAMTTKLDPEQQEYIQTSIQSGRSLLRILSDILDISQIEFGALHFVSEDFRLKDVFETIVQAFDDQARAKGLAFICKVDPRLPEFLRGDAGRIRQVAYNLVGNALKYTEQGEVCLEAYSLPQGTDPDVLRLHLAVSDTGIGVSEDKLHVIFESFTQVDGSYTRQYGGIGLGLAIVKRLVGLMGGDITFCSEVGVGTDVHVTLPLKLVQEPIQHPEPRPAAEPHVDIPRLSVLLAEDDPVNLLTVSHMLTKYGHEVFSVKNGAEVLDILSGQRVDCVLMDIQMPGMDGKEATRRIRSGEAGEEARNVTIIALTAHAMKGDREQFLAAGMDGYIAKPVDMEELNQALGKVLSKDV